IPVSIRISGSDIAILRRYADEARAIFQAIPIADRVRDDWGAPSFSVRLQIDPDRANLAGISNVEVAQASVAGITGLQEPRLREVARRLPPGYRLEIGGEQEEEQKGFKELAIVLGISVALIYLALMFQFKNAVKPFIVFAAIPYGVVGALAALWIMRAPF